MSRKNRNKVQTEVAENPVDTAVATVENATVDTVVAGTVENAPVSGIGEPVESQPEPAKKREKRMSRVWLNGVKDGVVATINGKVESVVAYMSGFLGLNVTPGKGYDNYWANHDGFTNAVSFMKLSPQGVAKMMAVLQHRAADYIAQGGENGTEMASALEGLEAYKAIAIAQAQKLADERKAVQDAVVNAEKKLFEEAIDALAKTLGGDKELARQQFAKFAKFAKKQAKPVAAATVTNTEQTLAEAGTAIENAEVESVA